MAPVGAAITEREDVLSTRTVEPEVVKELRANPTVSVWPTAGRCLGVGRHSAYAACRNGTVRYVQIGRHWKVVSADLLRLLGLEE